jgi:hypothetical protein
MRKTGMRNNHFLKTRVWLILIPALIPAAISVLADLRAAQIGMQRKPRRWCLFRSHRRETEPI